MLFDLSWDQEDPKSRIMLKAQWLPDKIAGGMKLLGTDGLFEVLFEDEGVKMELAYNDFKGVFDGSYHLEPSNFWITAQFTSTCPSLNLVTLELKHRLSSMTGLQSRVSFHDTMCSIKKLLLTTVYP